MFYFMASYYLGLANSRAHAVMRLFLGMAYFKYYNPFYQLAGDISIVFSGH